MFIHEGAPVEVPQINVSDDNETYWFLPGVPFN